MNFLSNLQKIDRRVMYVLLTAVIVVMLIPAVDKHIRMPLPDMNEVSQAYKTINTIKPHKIVVISVSWSAGTKAENQAQMEAVVRHLFKKGIPFVILPWDIQGTALAEKSVDDIASEMNKKYHLHKEYGKDWISLGYRVPQVDMFCQGMASNLRGTWKKDKNGTPMDKIPLMNGIDSIEDVGAVVETTPSGSVGTWIAYIGQPKRVPIIYAPTAVMVPAGYNYLDAKQIAGMLPGLVGAAKYDDLNGYEGSSRRRADALSMAHALIIVLIILSNVGYYASKRQSRQAQEERQ